MKTDGKEDNESMCIKDLFCGNDCTFILCCIIAILLISDCCGNRDNDCGCGR